MAPTIHVGGIVLCGGRSQRMGRDKATLPFGPELMLERVVRILSSLVRPIVVVAAADQSLPPLDNVIWATDHRPQRGPLEGLAAGLEQLQDKADAAYVTSCDVPLLMPSFVQALIHQLQQFDIVVPVEQQQFHHPLAAVYRTRVLPAVQQLLAHDQLRPLFLFDQVNTLRLDIALLRSADPQLQSLMNLNHWDDYLAALKLAGFPPPSDSP